ncbi:YhfC family glutamic-type intramembrane protease [Paenibacillus sp. V4I7]|uniref:YhfC family glutamic-type intramembrane protease n=1 Tax=Paenibacillus sp. V4I7 TaxID=3042307 RepID=UPI0027D897A0|nr:YhfC family glutamic-type intramembrane protease [Paenibacillus sp. V4I7]
MVRRVRAHTGEFIQIALSLTVLYGIRTRKAVYLLYAVLIHALIDFFCGSLSSQDVTVVGNRMYSVAMGARCRNCDCEVKEMVC